MAMNEAQVRMMMFRETLAQSLIFPLILIVCLICLMYHCARARIICSHFPLVTDYYKISIRKWLAALQVGAVSETLGISSSSSLTSQAGASLECQMIHFIRRLTTII